VVGRDRGHEADPIGEFADRHHLTLTTLTRLANEAGLHFRRRTGIPLAYYALLTPCPPGP
jgi:hypothetical protein